MIAHDEEEPKTIQQALSYPTSKEWIKSMEEEMNSMKSNQVWDLVDLLPSRKTIGNKWVININVRQMVQLTYIKIDWYLRATRNKRELIMKRHSRMW